MGERSADDGPRQRILVIGQGRLIDVARGALDDAGAQVLHLREPTDREIRREMRPDVDAVMIMNGDDRASLRLALVVEGLRPERAWAAGQTAVATARTAQFGDYYGSDMPPGTNDEDLEGDEWPVDFLTCLAVETRRVVQLAEAGCRGLVAEGAVWSVMVVGEEPAVKGCGAFSP